MTDKKRIEQIKDSCLKEIKKIGDRIRTLNKLQVSPKMKRQIISINHQHYVKTAKTFAKILSKISIIKRHPFRLWGG
jgi:ABC-type antimicrobial peptide transport system permease subunit